MEVCGVWILSACVQRLSTGPFPFSAQLTAISCFVGASHGLMADTSWNTCNCHPDYLSMINLFFTRKQDNHLQSCFGDLRTSGWLEVETLMHWCVHFSQLLFLCVCLSFCIQFAKISCTFRLEQDSFTPQPSDSLFPSFCCFCCCCYWCYYLLICFCIGLFLFFFAIFKRYSKAFVVA